MLDCKNRETSGRCDAQCVKQATIGSAQSLGSAARTRSVLVIHAATYLLWHIIFLSIHSLLHLQRISMAPTNEKSSASSAHLPPPYSEVVQDHRVSNDERLPPELARIRHLGSAQREIDYDARVSRQAGDLVRFLWQVLAIDYQTETMRDIPPARHIKFSRCAMQLHCNDLGLQKNPITPLLNVTIIDLDEFIYKPAEELDILPEVINTVLRQYLKSTSASNSQSSGGSSRYMGCVDSTLQARGISGLMEKFCWDWDYLYYRLESFDAKNVKRHALRAGIVRATRRHVPMEYVWRRMIERRAKRPAEDAKELQVSKAKVLGVL